MIVKLRTTIRLAWTFYKNFVLFSAVITALSIRAFWVNGFTGFFGIFWCKLLTMGLTYHVVNSNKKQEYYYYQNLGVSKTLLWAATLLFDFVLFILLLILSYQFQ